MIEGGYITVDVSKETPYLSRLLHMEINGKAELEPVCESAAGVLIDAADMRLSYRIIRMADGTEYRITDSEYNGANMSAILAALEKINGAVKEEKVIVPEQLSENVLEAEIHAYALWLKKWFGGKKIIFFHFRNVYEAIDSRQRLVTVDGVEKKAALNCFYEKAYRILKKYISFEEINMPDVSYADTRRKEYYFFSCNDTVYTYLVKGVSSILDGNLQSVEELRKECGQQLWTDIEIALANETAERFKVILKQRKPLLISANKKVKVAVETKLSFDRMDWIDLSKIHGYEELQKILGGYSSREYACIIPKLYADLKILWSLKANGFEKDKDYVTCVLDHTRELKEFVGVYTDSYGNEVVSQTPNDIVLYGCGNVIHIQPTATGKCQLSLGSDNSVCIDKNTQFHSISPLTIILGDASSVSMGKNNQFIIDDVIKGDFGDIRIGNDCLFSTEILIKSNRPAHLTENKVILGDHVWAGYRSAFFSGCQIGVGSIVGARGVVEQVFPNNCIIAGDPARILKKDVAWNRDNCENRMIAIPKEYRSITTNDR